MFKLYFVINENIIKKEQFGFTRDLFSMSVDLQFNHDLHVQHHFEDQEFIQFIECGDALYDCQFGVNTILLVEQDESDFLLVLDHGLQVAALLPQHKQFFEGQQMGLPFFHKQFLHAVELEVVLVVVLRYFA